MRDTFELKRTSGARLENNETDGFLCQWSLLSAMLVRSHLSAFSLTFAFQNLFSYFSLLFLSFFFLFNTAAPFSRIVRCSKRDTPVSVRDASADIRRPEGRAVPHTACGTRAVDKKRKTGCNVAFRVASDSRFSSPLAGPLFL